MQALLDGCWTGAGRVLDGCWTGADGCWTGAGGGGALTEHQVEEVLLQEHLVYRSKKATRRRTIRTRSR